MPEEPRAPESELDSLEGIVDRFLERKLFGGVGPRYRSIGLLLAIGLGAFNAYRCTFRESAHAVASAAHSESIAANAAPTTTVTPWTFVPGLDRSP